ncbi:hypothetical protein LEAN103870_18075 [Legionella anisa]|uniref:Uncharacterized protein n=1 Tax=Legionella anisa TaxID=28082 RepID=A0AAX0WZ28_9GAMM|nr:hypothetical protein [Legionella anisa]AWN75833.1 hypothetical protein DLD14_14910 [Legionella anisa]KTC67368.1 hypothetical protein Lani_3713 [Legionella anisa]MBN5933963.1 hypothetical protein [Legionella anisa]MCW8424771.1 hypothetical protein [Legionella anisa]MCW8446110.1 hypothetical protein [Legionella anisa]
MNNEQITKLIDRAKKDPEFFHKLVFEPEQAVKELKKKNPSGNEIILHANLQAIVQGLVGNIPLTRADSNKTPYLDCPQTCGETCAENTCGPTCSVTKNAKERRHVAALESARFGGGYLICDENVTCCCTTGTCGSTCGGSTCDVTCSGDSCGSTCGDSCGYTSHLQMR